MKNRVLKNRNATIDKSNASVARKKGLTHCKRFIPYINPETVPFRTAAHFLIQNRTWKVVHGVIDIIPANAEGLAYVRTRHAWLEKQGMVYDPHYDLFMPKANYYKTFAVQFSTEYTYKQAREKMNEKKRYFDWEGTWVPIEENFE